MEVLCIQEEPYKKKKKMETGTTSKNSFKVKNYKN